MALTLGGKKDEMGVWLPPSVWRRNALTRARYKAKRNLKLTVEEAEALVALEARRHARYTKHTREKEQQKRLKKEEWDRLKAMGYPTTRPMQVRMDALLALEKQGGMTKEQMAEALGITHFRLLCFIGKYQRYYYTQLEQIFREKAEEIEKRVARERVESTERLLALNKQADEAYGAALDPEAPMAMRLKAAGKVKDVLGMTHAEAREDAKLQVQVAQSKKVNDTLNLLVARGRLAAMAESLKEDIVTDADVVEEEEDD